MPFDKKKLKNNMDMPRMGKPKKRGRDLSTPLAPTGFFDPVQHEPRYVKAQKSYDSILKVNPKKAEAFRKKKNNTTHSDGTGMYIEPGFMGGVNVADRTHRKSAYSVKFKNT